MSSDEEEQIKDLELLILKEKEHQIDIKLIIKTSLDQDLVEMMTEDEKTEQLMKLKTIHLEYLNIKKIENLEIFDKLQILFLQHNNITVIEDLETLINLEYLNLSYNQISVLQGLKTNSKLAYLDVTNNQISNVVINQLPQSIEILNISNNPIYGDLNIKKQFLCHLKYIDEIDTVKIDQSERFEALGIFPQEMIQYQKKITQRKIKKLVKFKKIDELMDIDQVDIKDNQMIVEDDNLTQNTIKGIHDLTESLITKAQTTQMERLFEAQQELLEYQKLHQEIRNKLYEEQIQKQFIVNNPDSYFLIQLKLKNIERSGAIKLSAQEIAEKFEYSFGAMISLGDIQLLKVDINDQEDKIIQSVYEDKQTSSYNQFLHVDFLKQIIKYEELVQEDNDEEDEQQASPVDQKVDSKFSNLQNAIELFLQFTKDIDQVKKVELEERFKQLLGSQKKDGQRLQIKFLARCKGSQVSYLHQQKLFFYKEDKEPAYLDLVSGKPFVNAEIESQIKAKFNKIQSFSFGVLQFDKSNQFQAYFKSDKIFPLMQLKSEIQLKDNPQNERIISVMMSIQHQFVIKFDIDLSLCKAIYEHGSTLYFRMLSPPAFYASFPGRHKYESNSAKSMFVRVDNFILNNLHQSEQITEIQRLVLLNNTTIQINFESNIDYLKARFATYNLIVPLKYNITQENLQKDLTYTKLISSKYLSFPIQYNILAVISQNKLNHLKTIEYLIRFCEQEIKNMKIENQQIEGIFELTFNRFFKIAQNILDEDIEKKNNQNLNHFVKILERAKDDYVNFTDPEMRLAYVRRISLTPSGVLYFQRQPEVTSGILRQLYKKIDHFLRIHFEDENQDIVLNIPYVTQCFYSRLLYPKLEFLKVQYELFTWSSSSLRSASCWFINYIAGKVSRKEIISTIGNFTNLKTDEIAKNAARLGQNLSSSFSLKFEGQLNILIKEDTYDKNNKLFTDGIGMISPSLIAQIRQKIKVPKKYRISAIQIRYEGAKGLLVLNKNLRDNAIHLRRSMIKYNPKVKGYPNSIQILDYNKFRAGYLNRQIIILLLTLKVKESVFQELQDEYLKKIEELTLKDSSIYKYFSIDYNDEQLQAPNAIEALKGYINAGMEDNILCQGILKRLKQRGLLQLRKKTTILVEKAARVLGVIDEHNILKGGEVYCLVQDENDEKQVDPLNVQGTVVVTRNPCLHPGDIKKLQAVSDSEIKARSGGINPYEELINCIVFPQVDESIPCQIAGGDLDGDLYFISWDERLLPDQQQKAMIYDEVKSEASKKIQDFAKNNADLHQNNTDKCFDIKSMLDFLFMYLNSDVLGKIDNSHLAQADKSQLLANDPVCLELAELHSEAVDFVKHGRPVFVDSKLMSKIFPDYMEKEAQMTYESQTIIGTLYRQIASMGLPQESFLQGYHQNDLPKIEIGLLYKFQDLITQCKAIKDDIVITGQVTQEVQYEVLNEEIQKNIQNFIDGNYKQAITPTLKMIQFIMESIYAIMNTYSIKNEFEIYSGNFTNFTSGDGLYFKRKLNIEKFQKRVIALVVQLRQELFAKFVNYNQSQKLQQISLLNFLFSYSPDSHQYPKDSLLGTFIEKLLNEINIIPQWKFLIGQITWYRGSAQYFFWEQLIEISKDQESDLI